MGNKIYKQSQLNKATSEMEGANYSRALQILKEEMKFRPRSLDALRLTLKVLFRQYELEKVEETYSRFYAVSPQEDILTKALLVKETIFYDESKARGLAKELLGLLDRWKITQQSQQQQVSQYNNSASVNQPVHLQQQQSSNNNSGSVINNFSATTEVNSASDSMGFARSVVLLLNGQFDETISLLQNEILSQGLGISPSLRFDAQVLMVIAYNKQRMFKNSLAIITDEAMQQLCASSKDKAFEMNALYGETLAAQSKIEQSIDKYKECLKIIPTNTYVMYRLFNLCVRLNDSRGSRSYLDHALKTRPNDSLCAKMQGDQYIIMKDTKNAIKMYEKGVLLNKKCYRCLESLGDVCSDPHSSNQRLNYYEKCAKVNVCYTDVMIKIGIHYMQHSDDYLEALRWFFKALENRSQHKLIYFYISRSYYQNDQYEYALKNLGISLNITYEKINDQLSQAVKILNRYGEFFKVSTVIEFIEAIRFKYFQYFETISLNLESAAFARLFKSYIIPTQMHIQFFGLYKSTLTRKQKQFQQKASPESLVEKQHTTNMFANLQSQLSSPAPAERNLFFSVRNIGEYSSNGSGKNSITPLHIEVAEIAQKYFMDLLEVVGFSQVLTPIFAMAQACDKYTRTALMGNWYEERLAPNQPFRDSLQTKTARQEDSAISFASDTGQLIPLARVNRNLPWVTQGVVADDGFKEFRSTANTTYDPVNLNNFYGMGDCRQLTKHYTEAKQFPENNPAEIQTQKSNQYTQLNQTNAHHLHKERDVPMNVTDFGSTFKKFPESHEKFYGMTTYHQSFSRPLQSTAQEIISAQEKKLSQQAGGNERPLHLQSTKMTSVLTGEKYKNEYDPKDNTGIQRAWLPYKDKALNAAEGNIQKNLTINNTKGFTPTNPLNTYKTNMYQVQQHDNANSLPIGCGSADFSRTNQPGEFRHVRTDVTLIRNQPLTKR